MANRNEIGTDPRFASKARARILHSLIVLISLAFVGRLAYLQIFKGSSYRTASEAQAIKQIIIEPFRGAMLDRFGNKIVHNEPSFSLTITRNDFRETALPLLSSILEISEEEILSEIAEYSNVSRFTPIKMFKDVDYQKVVLIEEYADYLPGVDVAVESKRLYETDANLAHILGYTREASRSQIDERSYYRPGDEIGQTGIESEYEMDIRGKKGAQFIAVNKLGKKVAGYDDGKSDVAARNGDDLILSIDPGLQKVAEDAFGNYRGALVALDPRNGEILAIVSKPDFDPSVFSGRISPELVRELYYNPESPMLFRAIQSRQPPGSTWKMLIALAALQEGIITERSTISCPGYFMYGRRFGCHGAHGSVAVRAAIRHSCNVYFYKVGLKLGYDKFIEYAEMFGFGEKTHIDVPGESNGILPTRAWLAEHNRSLANLNGKMVNYSIGQGEVSATPIQMAVYTATIANEGTKYQPHAVRAVRNKMLNTVEAIAYDSLKIPIEKKYFRIVKQGMYEVVNSGGTAGSARIDGISVCGKTGTAQNPHGKDHAWFVCFAPMENPEIAMAVFVENAGFGGSVAAPIARKVLMQKFRPDSVYKKVEPVELPDSATILQTAAVDTSAAIGN